MSETIQVRARVDPKIKEEAELILKKLGFTVSDLIRTTLCQVINHRGLPYEMRTPNKETQKVLEDSKNGIGVKRFENLNEMLEDLEN